MDLLDNSTLKSLLQMVDLYPGADVWGSLPRTAWSAWQQMAIHRLGPSYMEKLRAKRKESVELLRRFILVADKIIAQGGQVHFEWPRYCAGWGLLELG